MKRTFLAIALVFASVLSVSAKRADTILQDDPFGVTVTVVSVTVVLVALIVLFLLISAFGKFMVYNANKKSAKAKGVTVETIECENAINAEVVAAISLAVHLCTSDKHDHESELLTINKVARVYSPWSSKIHGLTRLPQRNCR